MSLRDAEMLERDTQYVLISANVPISARRDPGVIRLAEISPAGNLQGMT
jgi:hypothetical protein